METRIPPIDIKYSIPKMYSPHLPMDRNTGGRDDPRPPRIALIGNHTLLPLRLPARGWSVYASCKTDIHYFPVIQQPLS